ncbi:MAG: zf-TFIIB domain-containing protein, partial [Armatimonadota bacterium]
MDDDRPSWLPSVLLFIGLAVSAALQGDLVPLLVLVILVVAVSAIDIGLKVLPAQMRRRIARWLGLATLAAGILSVVVLVKLWPVLLLGGAAGLAGVAAFVVLAACYVIVGVYPARVAHRIVSIARPLGEPASMWDLVEGVRRRRAVVRWVLIGCILALGGVCAGLLALARDTLFRGASDVWLVVAVIALMLSVGKLASLRETGLGSPRLREVSEPHASDAASRAVEGVAIAGGVPPPAVRVVAHTSPTAFTVVEQGKLTTIFTSGLLALLSVEELQAVAAHEIAHIASDAIAETHTFDSMLDLLRILGGFTLVLFLLAVRSEAAAALGLFGAVVIIGVLAGYTTPEWESRPEAFAGAAVVLANPTMVAANLMAHVIGYALGYAEDFLADLRAVELTRHPEALHAALRRLREVAPSSPQLPMAYQFKYFTAEGIVPEDLVPVQPPIEMRLALLERIDPSLHVAPPVRQKAAVCPDCEQALLAQTIPSHYAAPIPVDRCGACGGIWFDALELYMVSTAALMGVGSRSSAVPAGGALGGSLKCPRCRLPLRRSAPYGASAGVWLHECTVCGGVWIRPTDLLKFAEERERRAGRTARVGPRAGQRQQTD